MNAQTDWDDVRYFLAVAREGSLSAAARVLGVNHSTVLRRLTGLEAAMGVQLFDKLPRGYVLTAAGEDMHRTALSVEDTLAAASRRLSGRDAQLEGTLRITTVDILAMHILPRHLAAFRALHPGIRVDMTVAEANLSLTRREADVAIRLAAQLPENLVGRSLSGLAFAPYGEVGMVARHGAAPPAEACWVGLDESFDHTAMVRWLRAEVPAERIVQRVNSVAVLVESVRAGLGYGLLPCALADRMPELRRVGPPVPDSGVRLWLLTHGDLRMMGRVRAFLSFMAAALTSDRDLLEGRLPQPVPALADV
ncbi:LysR family transcriptional regulator [Azospirillum doebereinerae]|uniref:LysR family transcriptional regulator n=1 Tax=Azospirillum doebereinerae TaxID=92933 RepID=A0A3S0V4V9_9PROT|nr:LysR family transcriptional regulator [Azospirillum doebereinerae]MCG5239378.1 LysR family transcriptional regulator [Azospirillum doebereinerae]RUQ67873.1 LysR family transcriptional regulator [Azospirillum doebereinerae]